MAACAASSPSTVRQRSYSTKAAPVASSSFDTRPFDSLRSLRSVAQDDKRLGLIACYLRWRYGRGVIASQAAANVRYDVGDVFIRKLTFPRRHLSVVAHSCHGYLSVEAARHDSDDLIRIAGDDRIVRERRKCARRALALRSVAARAVGCKDLCTIGVGRAARAWRHPGSGCRRTRYGRSLRAQYDRLRR